MHVSTPAKIILSGEHSVVYGAPAIGAPVALFLHSSWAPRDDGRVVLRAGGAERTLDVSAESLSSYRKRYAAFRAGTSGIRDVLPAPEDLAALTLAAFAEETGAPLPGLDLHVRTDIPVSCGLGSSSALILNLLQGAAQFCGRETGRARLLVLARDIEDFQHGQSSGLDLALVAGRGAAVYLRGLGVVRRLDAALPGLCLVHSGAPAVSTGECVARVRAGFANDNALWDDFSACTRAVEAALDAQDAAALRTGVMRNQKLLEHIGVVPEKVKSFVSACAARGIAAKVCGAGAVAGDGAGMLWALAGDTEALDALAREYGYGYGTYAIAG